MITHADYHRLMDLLRNVATSRNRISVIAKQLIPVLRVEGLEE